MRSWEGPLGGYKSEDLIERSRENSSLREVTRRDVVPLGNHLLFETKRTISPFSHLAYQRSWEPSWPVVSRSMRAPPPPPYHGAGQQPASPFKLFGAGAAGQRKPGPGKIKGRLGGRQMAKTLFLSLVKRHGDAAMSQRCQSRTGGTEKRAKPRRLRKIRLDGRGRDFFKAV